MALKKELARSIVADFHSAEAAAKAAEDWAKQFQKDQVPEEVETESVIFRRVRQSRGQWRAAGESPGQDRLCRVDKRGRSKNQRRRGERGWGENDCADWKARTGEITLTVRLGSKIKRVELA